MWMQRLMRKRMRMGGDHVDAEADEEEDEDGFA